MCEESTPPNWRAWFPDLEIPEGLTFDDLVAASALIRDWCECEEEKEATAIPLVVTLVQRLRAAAAQNRETGLSEPGVR